MTTPDSPKTPRADYAPIMEGGKPSSTRNLNKHPSLPFLTANSKQFSQDALELDPAHSMRSTEYTNDLQSTPPQPRSSCCPTPLRKIGRAWLALRWQLSRSLFAMPLPFLTSMFDVKLGDLFITLPICASFTITTALQAINDREVESTGGPPTYGLLLVFVLAVRNNSVLLALTGISYERALFYHKVAVLVTIILSGLHGLAYILAYDKGEISKEEDMVFSGTMAFGAMVLMFVLSLNFVRRRFFEFFLRTHWILFIVVIVFAVMHGASTALIGVAFWGVDMAFRHAYRPRIYSRGSFFGKKASANESTANVVSSTRMGVIARDQVTVSVLPGDIVQIQFPRVRKETNEEFKFEAGQYVFLCVPTISSLQWHPFTISSAPHESLVTFHIKTLGDWTQKLQTLVAESDNHAASFDVLVDGPYGSVSIDIDSPTTYSHIVLFSGGIGVTPMRSIVNSLHYDVRHGVRSGVERVHLVWSVRDHEMVRSLLTGHHHIGDAYFPHGIVNDQGGAFSSEFHLTRSERDMESADIDRYLGSRIRYGARPDITATLRSVGEQAKQSGKKRVAVLVCGPASMVRDVISKSLSLSWEMKIRFDVHSEVFEF